MMARMIEPPAEEFEIYRRVKSCLEEEADMRPHGYLLPGDSVYAQGGCLTWIRQNRRF
jgi:hypothetical protein